MAKEKMDIEKKKVKTDEFRVSFPNVFEPKAFENQEPKYSVVMLFDKKADLSKIKKAAFNAAIEKWGSKEKFPKRMRWPWRDGSEREDTQGYEGKIFITASSKAKPGLVDRRLDDITDREEFYAGCYARATLIAFAYEKMGNVGVSFSLQNIQKLRDGDAFSGRRAASDEFEAVDDGDDDSDNYDDDDMGF